MSGCLQRFRRGAGGAALGCVLVASLCAPAARAADAVAAQIRRDLAAGSAAAPAGDRLYAAAALTAFYAGRDDAPGWVSDAAPGPAAAAMLDAVRASRADGLEPGDYHADALARLLALDYRRLADAVRARRLAALELLASDAFLRLASDEALGRLDPATLSPRRAGADGQAPFARGLQAVFRGAAPEAVIEHLAPDGPDYEFLRAALARYRAALARGGLPAVAAGPPLQQGDRGARVRELARRLEAAGDLAAGGAPGDGFDAAVTAALRRFQAANGLAADGIAGPLTLALVNEPARYWIDRLRVNLERRRWLPRELPPTRVMVNIPAFRVTLYAEGKPELAERAIVGRSFQQTPEFTSTIRYLVVNPSWEVPASIAANEILPDVKKHPGYLAAHGYRVLSGWGANERVVDPADVDWRRLSPERLPYHFRQAPGIDNPLGRVKFVFPNHYDVYMHDTPARALFNSSHRAFSHGCIRVEHAARLAAALLRLDGREAPGLLLIDAAGNGDNQRLDLPKPVPIYIVYMTAWADETGMLQFRPDIYDRDAAVLAALDAPASGGFR